MDVKNICSLSGSLNNLQTTSMDENVIEKIRRIIYTWNYKSEYNLNVIKIDLENIIDHIILHFFGNENYDKIYKSVHCVVYNELFENLIPIIRNTFSKEDLYLYEKCRYLYKNNTTPEECGKSIFNSVPFTAAVVELSVLDTYKSPLEKISCLCSTYDLIFAEVKLALVSLISKYSDQECEIPIVNNEEIIPILIVVIMKSKMFYFASNLFYINVFGEKLMSEDRDKRIAFESFERALNILIKNEETSKSQDYGKLSPQLDVLETLQIMYLDEHLEETHSNANTIQEEATKRLVSLIAKSTSEKNCVPIELPKLFS